jgi:hypothetical protein
VGKGQQSQGGMDAGVLGTIANGLACVGASQPYARIRMQYAHPNPVRTDDRSSLWLLTGTDSAYQGLTGRYYESIAVRINRSVEAADGTRLRGRR